MNMYNPPRPGEFIEDIYLKPFGVSVRFLAEKLGVAPSTLNRIVKKQSGVSSEMAVRFLIALGRSPESWLAMQDNYDLWQVRQIVSFDNVRKVEFVEL